MSDARDLPLDAQDQTIPAWPGALVELPSGQSIFVRHTPRSEPGGGVDLGRVVHVHGLGGSSTNWTDLSALLAPYAESDAVDLPGFGRSPAPVRGDWSQAHQIRVLSEYVAMTGGVERPVHLTANSMGGAAALVVAAERPDLVRSLTLISPAVPDLRLIAHLRRSPMPVLLVPVLGALAERKLAALPPHRRIIGTIRLCVADPTRIARSRLDEALAELIERSALPHARHSGSRALRGLARSYVRPRSRSLWAQAARIQAPTLVLWGAQDRLVDVARAPRLAAAIPDARLVVLDGVGHVAMIESPEAVARPLLDLMQRTAAPPEGSEADSPRAADHGAGRPDMPPWTA